MKNEKGKPVTGGTPAGLGSERPNSPDSQESILAIVGAYMTELVATRRLPTVKTVCEKAGVSRPTFYSYFEGVEDLDGRFLALLYYQTFTPNDLASRDMAGLEDFLLRLFQFVDDWRAPFHAFLNSVDLNRYSFDIREVLRSEVVRLFPNLAQSRYPACHLELIVGVLVAALSKVVVIDRSLWPNLAKAVIEFTFGGFSALIREESPGWTREKLRILRVLTHTRRLVTRGAKH